MDFMATLRILVQRWYIVVPLLLLTVGGTVAAFSSAPPEYQTKASLVVLSPQTEVGIDPNVPKDVNAFLNFGGSQEVAAQVLQVRMSDTKLVERLESEGVGGSWTFEVQGGSGPLIDVVVTEETPERALASANRVLDLATSELADLQTEAGSPKPQLIRLSVVSSPSDPEQQYKKKIRAATVLAALGIAAALGATLATEGVLRGRRPDPDEDEAMEAESESEESYTPRIPRGPAPAERPPPISVAPYSDPASRRAH
jgi:uncharacterized protein involved in exopolysaccharide biosynthesis